MTPVPSAPTPPPADPEATALLRGYLHEHQRAVERTLASCGVPPADRPDVAQEVFLAASRELRRTASPIAEPRPWLVRVAIRRASNYRRAARAARLVALEEHEVERLLHTLETPEQRMGDCELLAALFDEIEEEAQSIVLAHLAEGKPWEVVAREHQVSIDHAKYVYGKALAAMEAALKRHKVADSRRGAVMLPFALVQLFRAARAEADAGLTVDEQQRRWEAIERKIGEDDGQAPEQTRGRASSADRGVAPTSTNVVPARPRPLLPPLGTFVLGGVAGFMLCAWLQDRPSPALPASAPSPRREVAISSPGDIPPVVVPSAPILASADARPHPEVAAMPTPARAELDYAALEQARAALAIGEPVRALRALQRCKGETLAEVRQGLWAKACAAKEATRLPECAPKP